MPVTPLEMMVSWFHGFVGGNVTSPKNPVTQYMNADVADPDDPDENSFFFSYKRVGFPRVPKGKP